MNSILALAAEASDSAVYAVDGAVASCAEPSNGSPNLLSESTSEPLHDGPANLSETAAICVGIVDRLINEVDDVDFQARTPNYLPSASIILSEVPQTRAVERFPDATSPDFRKVGDANHEEKQEWMASWDLDWPDSLHFLELPTHVTWTPPSSGEDNLCYVDSSHAGRLESGESLVELQTTGLNQSYGYDLHARKAMSRVPLDLDPQSVNRCLDNVDLLTYTVRTASGVSEVTTWSPKWSSHEQTFSQAVVDRVIETINSTSDLVGESTFTPMPRLAIPSRREMVAFSDLFFHRFHPVSGVFPFQGVKVRY
jgi:hypothetical protein